MPYISFRPKIKVLTYPPKLPLPNDFFEFIFLTECSCHMKSTFRLCFLYILDKY